MTNTEKNDYSVEKANKELSDTIKRAALLMNTLRDHTELRATENIRGYMRLIKGRF